MYEHLLGGLILDNQFSYLIENGFLSNFSKSDEFIDHVNALYDKKYRPTIPSDGVKTLS